MTAFRAYLAERFPVGAYLVLVGAMVAATLSAASWATHAPVAFWPVLPLGIASVLLGFFVLRVFDEHKDWDRDRIAHPDRVLSRGLITLPTLARAGLVAAAVSVLSAFAMGLHAGLWMVAALGFSVLMRYEFFASEWLRDHIVVYAITHNPVVALLMMVPLAGAAGGSPIGDSGVLTWLGLASVSSLGFEVGRKLRAPENEKPMQDTYTQSLGISRAVALTLVIHAGSAVLALLLLKSPWTQGAAVALMAWAVATALGFQRSPTPKRAKGVELGATLLALGLYILVVVDAGLRFGLS
ncbi:MAG: hypothetical protein IV100_23120 [Myxococcales bacterium]|nr:hypothetical protein [Myxococcales bacterium]